MSVKMPITYQFVDVTAADCLMLTQTWVQASFEKDPEHFLYLRENALTFDFAQREEAEFLKRKLDENVMGYTLVTATTGKDSEGVPVCLGYLLAARQSIFSVEIERLCSVKYAPDGIDLKDEKVGMHLLAIYLAEQRPPIEWATLRAHKNAIPFWQKAGFALTGDRHEVNGMTLHDMMMGEETFDHWREKGCAPA